LLAGLLAGQPFPATLDGSAQLRRRPMARVVKPLQQMGARIEADAGRAPLRIAPAALKGIDYAMPVASAQVKSAILLAGLYAAADTTVREPGPTRDHTERMLRSMGVTVETDGSRVTVRGRAARLAPLDLDVAGDFSSAAFVLVAATIVPESAVTIRQVGTNGTRTGLLEILAAMGAAVTVSPGSMSGGEPAADLTARGATLRPVVVRGDMVVRAIDELPIWAVAATQAAGESVLAEAAELRVKEVDRIAALVAALRRMGADVAERPDGLAVRGPARLRGAVVQSHGDHRLAMALAVAGLAAEGSTLVQDAGCIADSFPGFAETLSALGATVTWQ
jgi:3-phosphoshikimate 1-carboxyvinyltransferase